MPRKAPTWADLDRAVADGPREKLRAWQPGDADLPQHTLDNLAALEKAGQLKPADLALLRRYEALHRHPEPPKPPKPPVPPVPPPPAPPPPPPDRGDSGGLADLLDRVEAWVKDVPVSAIRATPDSLGQLMHPQGNLKAGDVVVLTPGTYAEQYVLAQEVDGTPALPLVFVGTEGVVITGVVAVDNPNTVAHSLFPAAGGRVRAGGFTITRQ